MSLKSALESLAPRFSTVSKGYNPADQMFHFEVTINGQSFDYMMGVGHAKEPQAGLRFHVCGEHTDNIPKDWRTSRTVFATEFRSIWFNDAKSHPTVDLPSVVECLLSDAQSGSLSFEHFCSEFGYDSDSRSAQATHNACRDNLCKMVQAFGFSGLAALERSLSEE